MENKNELTIATMDKAWYGDFKNFEEARKKQATTARTYIRNEIKKFNDLYPYCKTRVHVKSKSGMYSIELEIFIDSINWAYRCSRSCSRPYHIHYMITQVENKVLELDEDTIKILKLGL